MATIADVKSWVSRHRVQSEALGVSLLALVVFIGLGLKARGTAEPSRTELTKLQAAAAEIAAFRSAFKPSTPEQDIEIARRGDSVRVAIAREERVGIAQQIAATAEALGLNDVRVKFTPTDSAAAPVRPELVRSSVGIADYALTLECSGGLAAALSLVNELPASVAPQRITAANVNGRTQFKITLAIFESSAAPRVGMGPSGQGPND